MFDMSKRTARRFAQVLHGAVTLLSSASIVVSSVSASFAQSIIVDPSAPGTSFLQSSNGTPQVDIATPVQGVSLNQFSDFNVGADGLILNNSTTGGVSVIGQNVTANPNLMVSGPASTIVGEVTGPAPSSLTGTTEVFGQSAAVVIANPNGISCNGCAFLNSTSSTLTTGAPIIDGAEVDLLVTQGTVTIGPDGFQPGQQGGLFGRHVIVTGPVETSAQGAENDLLISGGAQRVQQFDGSDLSVTTIVAAPSTVARTSPFAIDAAEGGTLTGGDVAIRNPEAGQGVNLYGDLEGRSLNASSKGDLFYKTIDVEETATFSGSELRQYGALDAGGDVTVNARAFTLYDGRVIESAGTVSITADDYVVIAGEVSAKDIHIDVTTGSLTNTGFLMADGDLSILANENVSQQRQIAKEYDIYFDPALQQYLQAYYAQLLAGGEEADVAAQMIERASQHELVAEYIEKGATASGTNVFITSLGGDITNEGGAIAATQDVRLSAGVDIINTYLALRSRIGVEEGCPEETCGYRTDFHAAEILAGRDLVLEAARDIRNEASDIAAAYSVSLVAGHDIKNTIVRSQFVVTDTVPVELTRTATVCGKACTDGLESPTTTTNTYWVTDVHENELNILSPGRIETLYGGVSLQAGRDVISQASLISSGADLTIDAGGQAIFASYTDAEEHFVHQPRTVQERVCGTAKDSLCYSQPVQRTTTLDGTVLATASSSLIGQTIRVLADQDITLIGARLLAERDLSLTSSDGAVWIDGADLIDELPGGMTRDGSKAPQLVELDPDLAPSLFGLAGGTETTASGEAYIAFLQENDLLTAVEALRRTESGADIRDAARSVGAQSYISLADNTQLDSAGDAVAGEIHGLWAEAGAEIAAHDAEVRSFHDVFRSELTALETRLAETPEERQAELDVALEGVAAAYQANVANAEAAYDAALAASEAQYGHLLTKQERRTRKVGWGKASYTEVYYVTVPDQYYIDLKAATDAQALLDRDAALQLASSELQLNTALTQAAFTDAGIADEMAALAQGFADQINSFGALKTVLVENFNESLGQAMRRAELALQEEAAQDALRREVVAEGSVIEGAPSLAAALTDQAFPELALTETVATTSDGIIENSRNGDERRVRLVTKTRDVGEFRDFETVREETRYTRTCSGYGKGEYCTTTQSTVTVPVTETRWVITGTEEYLDEEVYFDGVASKKALISSDKAAQDAFLKATAWRFGSGGTQSTGYALPWNQLLASDGDLTLTASTDLRIEDGSVGAKGLLNAASMGDMTLTGVDLDARDIRLVAGGALAAEALNMQAAGDAALFGTTGLTILPRGWGYVVEDVVLPERSLRSVFETLYSSQGYSAPKPVWDGVVIGELAAKDWGVQDGQTLISQELSQIVAGGDLTLTTLGDMIVGGTDVQVGQDMTMTAYGNLGLTAPRSVIEYHVGDTLNGTDLWDVRGHRTKIAAGGNVTARAAGTTLLEGSHIDAQGAIDLASGGDLILSAAQDVREYRHRTYSSGWFSEESSQLSETRVINQGAELTATGDITLESTTGDLTSAGAQLESLAGDINLSATEGDIYAGTFTDIDRREAVSHSSTFFGLFSSDSSSLVDIHKATATDALAAADLSLVSGGDTTLIGAQLAAGNNLNLNVGGDLNIEAAISSERREFFESNVGAVLATTETERSHKETAILTSLNADGDISFSVGGETKLTLYSTPDAASASVTELYPEELEALAGLVLLDQELLDEYFYDKTTALSPAFTMALTITLGIGFEQLLMTSNIPGMTAMVNGTKTLSHLGRAVSSMAASTTVGIANGTVSGELDLGEILKNAAISAGTSYLQNAVNLKAQGDLTGSAAMNQLGEAANDAAEVFGNRTFNVLGGSAWGQGLTDPLLGFGKHLTVANVLEGAFDVSIGAGIQTVAYGGSFGDVFKDSFINSVVALGLADVQTGIGGVFADNQFGGEGSLGHVLLHGFAGCVAAEAQGADCAAGAAGGIAGAIYSGLQKAPDPAAYSDAASYNAAYTSWKADVSARADLLGVVGAWVFSGGKAENVSVGHSIATSVVANNYLRHEQWVVYLERLSACDDDAHCLSDTHDWAENASLTNQHGFLMCEEMNTCAEHYAAIEAAEAGGLTRSPMASDLVNALQNWSYSAASNPNIAHGTAGYSSVLDLTGLGDGKGSLSYYDFANANCNGVAGATCVAAFHSLTDNLRADRNLTNSLVTLGLAGGLIGSMATPQLAALCMANQTCTTAYLATEGAGTFSDFAACAEGDVVACAGVAIPVATTGGMGDDLVELVTIGNRGGSIDVSGSIDDVAERYAERGRIGDWNAELNNPQPNTLYRLDNGDVYLTDTSGRVAQVRAELRVNPADRNSYQQRISGGDCRLPSDCGGHLIASVFGGAGEGVNLVPMDRVLNGSGGKWYELEREWRRALDAGQDVSVDIRPIYPDGSTRPERFEVAFSIGELPQQPQQIFNTASGLPE